MNEFILKMDNRQFFKRRHDSNPSRLQALKRSETDNDAESTERGVIEMRERADEERRVKEGVME
ncbi:hypothetical protein UPYG_G00091600 [Umbra pygmaea]|uniref:Uncharacterized protein n=1 Tax=Umbra pygmaea TaxID=75934 RepID=A0ABD0XFY3_UMBPY